jgi:hypothetical protein
VPASGDEASSAEEELEAAQSAAVTTTKVAEKRDMEVSLG